MLQQRQILTPVTHKTHAWLLEQNSVHGARFSKVLSAARITRSVLAGLAAVDAPVGALADGEAIEKYVADVFAQRATEAAQQA
jgi:hypothetical protein